ncbi:hypothetical protein TD95_000426 [Thielaviopsis punctulata]|uniref:Carboxylesterase type B domain-containing protein n=1 Tax=Thielaviopsis punctulata TaxID=72032 RepID=A0A0F4ZGU1_9PEZI|nr:hypothetical protein TD95_000426 [Thielaviopsis punctulata]
MRFFDAVFSLVLISLLSPICSAAAVPLRSTRKADMPVLALPYGSFRAVYNARTDINIPYAAPPVGDLRWRKPQPPLTQSGIQDGRFGPRCPQGIMSGFNIMGPGNQYPVGRAINQMFAGLPVPEFRNISEDCLYMDIYVPGKAIIDGETLPVVVWYDGSGMINQSKNNIIFVSFNYRLGSFGWMAGTTMEKDGLPNAGLWDQRAAFQWVQDYIHLVGGDPDQVTAMGESAGGSSLEHLLVAKGGTLDPLFRRAIIMSPAFQPMWDRDGSLEDIYNKFERFSGCEGQGLHCLRKQSSEKLIAANTKLLSTHHPGSFALGPSADGDFIRQLAPLELSQGHVWPIESMIVSHTSDEGVMFVSGDVITNDQFMDFMHTIFPQYTFDTGLVDLIAEYYPPVSGKHSVYPSQAKRLGALIRDACITCNNRYLNKGIGDRKSYDLQYSALPGWHGADLFAVFFNPKLAANSWLQLLAAFVLFPAGLVFSGLSRALQSYYTSYVITGDPNTRRVRWNLPPTVEWHHPRSIGRENVANVVNVGNLHVSTVSDDKMPLDKCDFWLDVFAAATAIGGYAPEDEVIFQTLVNVSGNASWRCKPGSGTRAAERSETKGV